MMLRLLHQVALRNRAYKPPWAMILRSTEWDGLAPAPGDVVQLADGVAVVTGVARGPGVGQWRITAEPARLIVWSAADGR